MTTPDQTQPTQIQSERALAATEALSSREPIRGVPGYRFLDKLGEGAFGEVWRAQQLSTDNEVAVKVFTRFSGLEHHVFRSEVERLLRLDKHPNIVTVLDAGLTHEPPYYVMQLVGGGTLAEVVHADQRPSMQQVLRWMNELAEALGFVHGKGLIHCDLKPGNVLLDEAGHVRVSDFGQSRVFTEASATLGTLFYMAPEQARTPDDPDRSQPDVRWDVFALGATVYALLTGHAPHATEEHRRALEEAPTLAIRLERYRAMVSTSREPGNSAGEAFRADPELAAIVHKCLAADAAERYESIANLRADLDALVRHFPVSPLSADRAYRLRKFLRRNRAWVAASVVVAFSLGAGLAGTTAMYLRASANEAKARKVSEFMSDILKGAGPGVAMGRDTTMLKEMLDQAAKRITGGELEDSPEAEVKLRNTIGFTYFELRQSDRAMELLEPAVALARSLHGGDHPDVVEALINLGYAHKGKGDWDDAERLFREALAMARRLWKESHQFTVRALSDIGGVAADKGQLDEAVQQFREALDMARKVLGSEHRLVAITMGNLASALELQSRFPEAERLHRDALALQRKLFGEESNVVAQTINNLALSLIRQGRPDEAETHAREALALRRRVLDSEHPDVAQSLNTLGVVLHYKGSSAEAEPLFREALALGRKVLRDEHPEVLMSLQNLVAIAFDRGDYDEAVRLGREALALHRKRRGSEDPNIVFLLGNLSAAMTKNGLLGEAERLGLEALDATRRIMGAENHQVARILNNLGNLEEARGRYEYAKRYYQDAVVMKRRLFGDSHPATTLTLSNIAGIEEKLGHVDEAERLNREVLDVFRRTLDPGHPHRTVQLSNLANLLACRGNHTEAESLARECLKAFDEDPSLNLPDKHVAMTVVGAVMTARGEFAEAEKHILQGCDGIKDHPAVDRKHKRDALQRAVTLYDSWNAAEPGKGYDRKAADWRAKLDEFNAANPAP